MHGQACIFWASLTPCSLNRLKTLGTIGAATAPVALPASSACDIEVHFARPAAAATLAVEVEGGTFHLDYVAGDSVNVGFTATDAHAALAGTDSRGKPVGMQDVVTMLPSDTVISMRIFLDTNCGEVYFMGGCVDARGRAPPSRRVPAQGGGARRRSLFFCLLKS